MNGLGVAIVYLRSFVDRVRDGGELLVKVNRRRSTIEIDCFLFQEPRNLRGNLGGDFNEINRADQRYTLPTTDFRAPLTVDPLGERLPNDSTA